MARPRNLVLNTVKRVAPTRGPFPSSFWNSTIAELVADLAAAQRQWNTFIVPLTSTLPDGSGDAAVDVFKNGLDGKNIYVDSATSGPFYDSSKQRPKTLSEQLTTVNNKFDTLESQLSAVGTGNALTDTQKAQIGINVFDSSRTSSATSIDGRGRSNQRNLDQVARDLYGDDYILNNDGAAILDNSLKAMVDALLEAHGGDWTGDVSLTHDIAFLNIPQSGVNASEVVDDNWNEVSSDDLQDDLNQIRTRIRNIATGTGSWTAPIVASYVGGPTSLQKVIAVAPLGGVSKSVTNPWGYAVANVDGLRTFMDAIESYVGMNGDADSSPVYSSTNYIQTGDSLELAVSKLDETVFGVSGLLSSDEAIGLTTAGWQQLSHPGDATVKDFVEFAHQVDTNIEHSGQLFRRLEEWIPSGSQLYTVTHNRGRYPIVQAIIFDPAGGVDNTFFHTSVNEFVFSGQSVVNSGLVIAIW